MSLYNLVNPASLIAGQPEDVSQVLANFQAIQAVLNGGIDDVNIRSTAAIAASKLAGYPTDGAKALRGDGTWGRVSPTYQILTAASGTYTTPAGCKAIFAECVAGGGGGGGANVTTGGQQSVGGGGGGGAYSASLIQAPAATYAYVVGAGGPGGVGVANGTIGNDTTFGATIIVAKAGAPGTSLAQTGGASGSASGGVGGAATSGTGDVKVNGGGGGAGIVFGGVGSVLLGPGGAGAVYGAMQQGTSSAGSNGIAGSPYGGGGEGAGRGASTSSQTGGAGAAGVIIVWEFY